MSATKSLKRGRSTPRWADSTGRRNTILMGICEEFVEGFSGCFPAQRFAKSCVDV